jgi:hypothetical protein
MWYSKHILLPSIVVVMGTTPLHYKFSPSCHCRTLVDGVRGCISIPDASSNSEMFNTTLGS